MTNLAIHKILYFLQNSNDQFLPNRKLKFLLCSNELLSYRSPSAKHKLNDIVISMRYSMKTSTLRHIIKVTIASQFSSRHDRPAKPQNSAERRRRQSCIEGSSPLRFRRARCGKREGFSSNQSGSTIAFQDFIKWYVLNLPCRSNGNNIRSFRLYCKMQHIPVDIAEE